MPRQSLSVCVISCNEEDKIRDCLESVKWADELIVVDSHSTDRTREIAREYTEQVIERDWPGHVDQKNFAAARASSDWILGLDADERVSEKLKQSILEVLEGRGPRADGYAMPRLSRYLGRWWKRGGWYPDRKLRLWRRGRGKWTGDNPHDRVELDGKVGLLRGDILHFTYDDIADHIRTMNSFTTIASRSKRNKGMRFSLFRLLFHPVWAFFRHYLLKRAILEGVAGFIMACNAAFYVYLKYAKIWEAEKLEGADESRRG